MAEYIYNDIQLVQPGAAALLETAIGCNKGYVLHRPGSGILTLRGMVNNPCARFARYRVAFDGNIAGANMIQEAKNSKYPCLIHVNSRCKALKVKADSLEGYVKLF